MASISEEEKILEAAVAGIPRVAEVVASIPAEDRGRALDAAERSYLQTVQDLCCPEGAARNQVTAWASVWVSALMVRLRAEVKAQASAKQKVLEALHDEVLQAETRQDDNVLEIRRSGER